MAPVTTQQQMSPRILVVEDHEDSREMLRELLELLGATTLVANSVNQALELVDEGLQIVLSDIGLPDVDGYELARRLQSHPKRSSMRLVAMTGYTRETERACAIEAGFDDVLTKPLAPGALEALVRSSSDVSSQ